MITDRTGLALQALEALEVANNLKISKNAVLCLKVQSDGEVQDGVDAGMFSTKKTHEGQ